MTLPENMTTIIRDLLVNSDIDLQRVDAATRKEVTGLLNSLSKEIKDKLTKWDFDAADTQVFNRKLNQIVRVTAPNIERAYRVIEDTVAADLSDVAQLSQEQVTDAVNSATNIELVSNKVHLSKLRALAGNSMIEGAPINEWWGRQTDVFKQEFKDQIRQGMLNGETIPDMIRRVQGSRANRFQDGIIARAGKRAHRLVRTSVLTVANQARMETYKTNARVIKGVQWLSTLDSRTSDICMGLDGQAWTLEGKKMTGTTVSWSGPPPAHWNCRSTLIPVVKTFTELAKEKGINKKFTKLDRKLRIRARAAMDGKQAQAITYEGWLRKQSQARQQEVLGITKWRLWSAGKITVRDLIDQSGNPRTAKQLLDDFGGGTIKPPPIIKPPPPPPPPVIKPPPPPKPKPKPKKDPSPAPKPTPKPKPAPAPAPAPTAAKVEKYRTNTMTGEEVDARNYNRYAAVGRQKIDSAFKGLLSQDELNDLRLSGDDVRKHAIGKQIWENRVDDDAAINISKTMSKSAVPRDLEDVNFTNTELLSKHRLKIKKAMQKIRKDLRSRWRDEVKWKRNGKMVTTTLEEKTNDFTSLFKYGDKSAVDNAGSIRWAIEEAYTMAGGQIAPGAIVKIIATGRAYANKFKRVLNVGRRKKSTIFHELGHFIEFNAIRVEKAAHEFLDSRKAINSQRGLDKFFPKHGYRNDEYAYPSDVLHAYMGKTYPDGATEVISMGFESFASVDGMIDLFYKDRDLFEMILGILYRKPGG